MSTAPLSICVLGGSGFVGTELVARLAAEGHWVRVPTRQLARASHLLVLPTVEVLVANVHEPRALGRLFAGVDAVVNLVGILNERARRDASFQEVHTELAAKVLEAVRAARVPRLLHMSSLGARPDAPSRYLRSKAAAETRLQPTASAPRVTIFRPSVIFGPGDSLTRRFARLLRLGHGFLPLARPNARFAPIYVEDVVEAFVRVLHDQASGDRLYELCGPDVLTLEQLVRITAAAAGLPCRILRLPDSVARLQAIAMGLLPGQPFSLDNFRSLTVDSVCRQDGCARLGIRPAHLAAVAPLYLSGQSLRDRQLSRSRHH